MTIHKIWTHDVHILFGQLCDKCTMVDHGHVNQGRVLKAEGVFEEHLNF